MKIALLLLLLGSVAPAYAQEGEYEADLEKQLFQSVNQEREKRGFASLKWNDKLRESARRHTDRLAETEILSHQFKDEPPLMQRIAATDLNFYQSAENVALATDWPDIHSALMQSEGHRRNILNPSYTDIGIGVRKRGGTYYVTQNFARTTQLLKPSDAEEKIALLIREDRRFGRVRVTSAPALREAACAMAKHDRLNAREIPADRGDHGVMAFTSSDLNELPPAMDEVASRSAGRVSLGSCFKATPTYPGGTYWFAVVY
jgi:hypothetical protein